MAPIDLNIHSSDGITDSDANRSNIDEMVTQMIADKRIDGADKQIIDDLQSALDGST